MNRTQIAALAAAVVLGFAISLGIAYSVGGGEGPTPAPGTVTRGFEGTVVTTAPSTNAVRLPSVRATPSVPDLKVPAPSPTPSHSPSPTPSPTPKPPVVVPVIEAG